MHSDASQVSRTHLPHAISAGGHRTTWAFSDLLTPTGGKNTPADQQDAPPRPGTMWGKKPRVLPRWRFADRLAQAALHPPVVRGENHEDTAVIISLEEARSRAYGLRIMGNAATAALRVSTARGQLSCWRRAIPDLPPDYLDGVDTLEAFQDQMIADLHDDQRAVAPHIARLNDAQPSRSCWARPVPEKAHRGIWTGKDPWVTHAHDYLTTAMQGPSMAISAINLRALLQALVSLVSATGRGLTASHRTIAELARRDHGCTLALSTATQRVRTIRRLLERGGFHRTHVVGGHLNSLERLAAQAHHGGRQTRCGSTCDLILPRHLRPTAPRPDYTPDTGLAQRLQERDQRYVQARQNRVDNQLKSTYVCDSGFHSSQGYLGVSHSRASAREEHISSMKRKISIRSWTIADALTRCSSNTAARGPYAHLVGENAGQISLKSVAQLIEEHTPSWADTREVMRGLVHAATGQTGYVALGLKTRPRSAWAWLQAVLGSIAWDQQESWPVWSVTAKAFGVDWRGARHCWDKTPATAPAPVVASAPIRTRAMKKIRAILEGVKAK